MTNTKPPKRVTVKESRETADGLYMEHLTEKGITRKNNPYRVRGRRIKRRRAIS